MEPITLIVAPAIVYGLTHLVKKMQSIRYRFYGTANTAVVRLLAATFSFLAVIAGSWVSGTDVDVASIQTFAEAIAVFLSATGIFFFTKGSR